MTITTTEGPPLEGLLRRLAECPPEFHMAPWLDIPGAKTGRGVLHVDALVRDWFFDAGLDPLAQHEAARYRTISPKARPAAAPGDTGAGAGQSGEISATTASVPLAGAPSVVGPAGGTGSGASAGAKAKGGKNKDAKGKDKAVAVEPENLPATTAWLRLVSICIWLLNDPTFLQSKVNRARLLVFLNTELEEVTQVSDATKFVTDGDRREELVRRALRAFGLRPARESSHHATDRLTTLDSVELRRVAIAARQAEERARAIREAMARKAAEEAAATYNRE